MLGIFSFCFRFSVSAIFFYFHWFWMQANCYLTMLLACSLDVSHSPMYSVYQSLSNSDKWCQVETSPFIKNWCPSYQWTNIFITFWKEVITIYSSQENCISQILCTFHNAEMPNSSGPCPADFIGQLLILILLPISDN